MQQQNLVLILARELADKLATPTWVVDGDGKLIYFNEGAADVLGMSFGEAGHVSVAELAAEFKPVDDDGRSLSLGELPLGVAMWEHQPAHGTFRITDRDGNVRSIAATAFPLFAHAEHFVGAVAIFWEAPVVAAKGAG
jgi:PAS domain S-box-containing protein